MAASAGAGAQQEPGEPETPALQRRAHPQCLQSLPHRNVLLASRKRVWEVKEQSEKFTPPQPTKLEAAFPGSPCFFEVSRDMDTGQPGMRTYKDYQAKAKGFLETDRRAVVGQQNGVLYHCFKGGQGDLDELLRSHHP